MLIVSTALISSGDLETSCTSSRETLVIEIFSDLERSSYLLLSGYMVLVGDIGLGVVLLVGGHTIMTPLGGLALVFRTRPSVLDNRSHGLETELPHSIWWGISRFGASRSGHAPRCR